MKQSKNVFKTAAVLLLWVAIWQFAAMIIAQEFLIPTPIATLKTLIVLAKTEKLYISILFSLLRIVVGYLLGVVLGILGAVASYHSKLFDALFSPILKLIKAVPVASFIILALVWFKSDDLPIFIAFLMVLPMIWSTVKSGLDNIDKNYLELARVYKLDNIKTFFEIKLPFILPSLVSTALTALGFAWKSGVAAEVICRPSNSLGNMLQEAKIYIETAEVFAITAVVALLSIILENIIKAVVRRYSK